MGRSDELVRHVPVMVQAGQQEWILHRKTCILFCAYVERKSLHIYGIEINETQSLLYTHFLLVLRFSKYS
jgi:hypothetical protein